MLNLSFFSVLNYKTHEMKNVVFKTPERSRKMPVTAYVYFQSITIENFSKLVSQLGNHFEEISSTECPSEKYIWILFMKK